MVEVRQTAAFIELFDRLCDQMAKKRIVHRINRAQAGNYGDYKRFSGICEIRIDHGPGYRLYFADKGGVLIILLCGGDKSTQKADIATAIRMAKEI